jgi:signal transduction histidine kinase
MKNFDLTQWLFLIFFIYGLAFFGMGVSMALESGRRLALAEARVLRPLAAFGLIHGAHEWFESYLLQAQAVGAPVMDWVAWVRLGMLSASFLCLFLFARNLLISTSLRRLGGNKARAGLFLFALYALVVLSSAILASAAHSIPEVDMLDGLVRYLMAVPSSLLASLALRARARQARAEDRPTLEKYFRMAALGFGVYTLTQYFVHPINMFPANLVNEEAFLTLMGFPIQMIRTLVAILIAYSLLRGTQAVEEERNLQLFAVQQARLQALQQRDELRRSLLRHTVQAQEDERSRVARELHDETAQILSAVSLHLAALRVGLKRKPEELLMVEQLQELTRQMSQGLYRLVRDLRPAHLDDLGVIPALNYLLAETRSASNIEFEFSVQGTPHRLDLSIETILFRVTQEAANNIVRHAKANRARVELVFGEDSIHLTVTDQGQGFDPQGPFQAPRGWGLEGMRERIESAGGIFQLKSAPGQGTQLDATIPL